MAPLEGPWVYRKIARLYSGRAGRATAGMSAAGTGTSGFGANWSSRAVQFRRIRPKAAGLTELAAKYAANACESRPFLAFRL